MQGASRPTDALAQEKMALVRSFLYGPYSYFLTPTVDDEWRAIPDPVKRALHASWNNALFGTLPLEESTLDRISARVQMFSAQHSSESDCRVLAEAEVLGADGVLSYDHSFVSRLAGSTSIDLLTPSSHWLSLGIRRGAKLRLTPSQDNPLAEQKWWRWEAH